jgi:hypothetical protein
LQEDRDYLALVTRVSKDQHGSGGALPEGFIALRHALGGPRPPKEAITDRSNGSVTERSMPAMSCGWRQSQIQKSMDYGTDSRVKSVIHAMVSHRTSYVLAMFGGTDSI